MPTHAYDLSARDKECPCVASKTHNGEASATMRKNDIFAIKDVIHNASTNEEGDRVKRRTRQIGNIILKCEKKTHPYVLELRALSLGPGSCQTSIESQAVDMWRDCSAARIFIIWEITRPSE